MGLIEYKVDLNDVYFQFDLIIVYFPDLLRLSLN